MTRLVNGLVVAAEFLDRFEADLAAAALRAERIEVALSGDTRGPMVGPGVLGPGTRGTDPVIELLVNETDLARAQVVLATATQLPPEFRDDVVGTWADGVETHGQRIRRLRRVWILGWIYLLTAVIVLLLIYGALS